MCSLLFLKQLPQFAIEPQSLDTGFQNQGEKQLPRDFLHLLLASFTFGFSGKTAARRLGREAGWELVKQTNKLLRYGLGELGVCVQHLL